MTYQTIIEQEALSQDLHNPRWRIFDCRNFLTEPGRGLSEYEQSHIPNASYLNLEDDLSGPIFPGETGRHPLPDPVQFSQRLGQWGVNNQTQVIVYDQGSGAIAARLWWMMRWLGHDKVAVLNGGWAAWARAGLPVTQAQRSFEVGSFFAEYSLWHYGIRPAN